MISLHLVMKCITLSRYVQKLTQTSNYKQKHVILTRADIGEHVRLRLLKKKIIYAKLPDVQIPLVQPLR